VKEQINEKKKRKRKKKREGERVGVSLNRKAMHASEGPRHALLLPMDPIRMMHFSGD
jgi:urease accessory protein UreE